MRKSTLAVSGFLAAAIVVGSAAGGAYATTLITGANVKDGSLTGKDIANGSIYLGNLSDSAKHALKGPKGDTGKTGLTGKTGATGHIGLPGHDGVNGKDGKDSLLGAYYAVANYDVGDTNQGAIATVACDDITDVAIAGGVQMIGLGGKNSAVGSSFPGRMDWNTNTPKADRLDGWIVQFDATVAPEKTKVWALCVPGASVPVHENYTQSS